MYHYTFSRRQARASYLSFPADDVCKFEYAYVLARSASLEDKMESVDLLKSLLKNETLNRNCCFIIATTLYSLGRYTEARTYCEHLFRREPDNAQVQ